jgi:hypothetical protein
MTESEPMQFPVLTWLRGSTLSTTVEHGIFLREKGRLLTPDYQRPLVWTLEQKVRFIESLVLDLPIGEYTLHMNPGHMSELLDGQQRWNAIFAYIDGEFPVFGLHYDDLNHRTKMEINFRSFPHRKIQGLTYDQRVEAYTRMAYGGTPHEQPA